jgi:hypothetical protein
LLKQNPICCNCCRLALYLLKDSKESCEALLRRLSIICLEDGLLHPQLPMVVWAMLAVVSDSNSEVITCGHNSKGFAWRRLWIYAAIVLDTNVTDIANALLPAALCLRRFL